MQHVITVNGNKMKPLSQERFESTVRDYYLRGYKVDFQFHNGYPDYLEVDAIITDGEVA